MFCNKKLLKLNIDYIKNDLKDILYNNKTDGGRKNSV
jgi:hypothetical protein